MNFSAHLASISGMQTLAVAAVAAAVTAFVAWCVQQQKRRVLQTRMELERTHAAVVLQAHREESLEREKQAQQSLETLQEEWKSAEDRLRIHQNASCRREEDFRAKVETLESALTSAREAAARLEPALKHAASLEKAVNEEIKKVKGLEQSLSLITPRAQDLARQLQDSREQIKTLQEAATAKETEGANPVGSAPADQACLEAAHAEMARLNDLQTSWRINADAEISRLQQALAAALALQTDAFAAGAAEANEQHNKVFEAKLAQREDELGFRSREDGRRIAELEYRLSEAHEATSRLADLEARVMGADALRRQMAQLESENEVLLHDLETLKMVQSEEMVPVPELLEDSLLRVQV